MNNEEQGVKLTILSIDGKIVFQHEHEWIIKFLGKGDDGEWLPNGTYMWHSEFKTPIETPGLGDGGQLTIVSGDNGDRKPGDIKVESGMLFVSHVEGQIRFVGMGSPVVYAFSIPDTADSIGKNMALIQVQINGVQ